jgi:L-2,4-diaminobutyrate decarboxylase
MSTESRALLFKYLDATDRSYHALREIMRDLFDPQIPFDPPPSETGTFNLERSESSSLVDILSDVHANVVAHSVNSRHPYTLAHMVPPPAVVSVFADLIIGAMNQCAFIWEEAPLAAKLEQECLGWLARRLGYKPDVPGLLTSGGTMSNCIATYLALIRAREMLSGERERYCIVASDQAHFSLEKAAVINGLSSACVVRAKTDSQGRLRPGEVWKTAERAKSDGRIPVLFVCTAGTTNAGVLELADEFLDAGRFFQAWCHIDAAHGGMICLSSRGHTQVRRWAEADSISWDPHKSLYISYATGALLLRDQGMLSPLQFHSEYAMREDDNEVHAGTCHLDGSRRFEALKLWMTIKHFGIKGYIDVIDHSLELAKRFARMINDVDDLVLLTEPDTNIVCFRFVGSDLSDPTLDALNTAVQKVLFLSGGPLVSITRIGGRVALRAVLINPLLETYHLAEILDLIRNEARRQLALALTVEEIDDENTTCYQSSS